MSVRYSTLVPARARIIDLVSRLPEEYTRREREREYNGSAGRKSIYIYIYIEAGWISMCAGDARVCDELGFSRNGV